MSWYTPDVPNLCPELRDDNPHDTPAITRMAPAGKRVYRSYHQAKLDGGPYCEVYAVSEWGQYGEKIIDEKDGVYTLVSPKKMFRASVFYSVCGLSKHNHVLSLTISDAMLKEIGESRYNDLHYKKAWDKVFAFNERSDIRPFAVGLFGFVPTLEDACFLVEKNHSDIYEAGEYPIVVIEEIRVRWMLEGTDPAARVFYQWDSGAEKYVRMNGTPAGWQDERINGYAPFIFGD